MLSYCKNNDYNDDANSNLTIAAHTEETSTVCDTGSRDRMTASIPCSHRSSTRPDTNWLPLINDTGLQGLANHPHCIYCKTVKNISSDRARGLGYYTAALGRMEELKRIQVRLISRELEAYSGFDDTYAMTGTGQMCVFMDIVKKYANIPEQTIRKYF